MTMGSSPLMRSSVTVVQALANELVCCTKTVYMSALTSLRSDMRWGGDLLRPDHDRLGKPAGTLAFVDVGVAGVTVPTTGIGSWPGTDFAEAVRQTFGLWDLPYLPELPARGPGADMIGRTLALLDGFAFERSPFGWQVADRPGRDQRRAAALLRDDLDVLAEVGDGYSGRLKISLAGPWTLMASVDLARGGRMLGDHGARRDMVAMVGRAIEEFAAALVGRVPGAVPQIQLDEPLLGAVAAGGIRTESGLHRYRSVTADELRSGLRDLVSVTESTTTPLAIHSCAAAPWSLLTEAGVGALALDAGVATSRVDLDAVANHVDHGGTLWLGILDTRPGIGLPTVDALVRRAESYLKPLELGRALLGRLALTPACGLASNPDPAGAAQRLRAAAPLVAERLAG